MPKPVIGDRHNAVVTNYNFQTLSPTDFEDLVGDILEAELNLKLLRYGTGRDRGIDLRHQSCPTEPGLIIQCKHYSKTGFSGLLSNLKNKELPKIRKLAPSRYILATSVSLTPDRRAQLFNLLTPHIGSFQDIYGQEDLNTILRQRQKIERSHFKLWMSSSAVLSEIINRDVVGRSRDFMESLREDLRCFVHTDAVRRSQQRLDGHGVCLISGVPGIGKTMMARLLLSELAIAGYEIIVVSADITEAERLWKPGERQAFYYDDFLGATALQESQAKNEDALIAMFMDRVNRDPDKRLVMTTREHLLRSARMLSDKLDRADIELRNVVVELDDYGIVEKARVLLNHLFFSNLSEACLNRFVNDRIYWQVIEHPNYNPRLIEQVILLASRNNVTADGFGQFFMDNLAQPTLLWTHTYDQQLNKAGREILLILFAVGGSIPVEDLFQLVAPTPESQLDSLTNLPAALKQLEGTFTHTSLQKRSGQDMVEFANPSVQDFITARLVQHQAELRWLIARAHSYREITTFVELARTDQVTLAAWEKALQNKRPTQRLNTERGPSPITIAIGHHRIDIIAKIETLVLVNPTKAPEARSIRPIARRLVTLFDSMGTAGYTTGFIDSTIQKLGDERGTYASRSSIDVRLIRHMMKFGAGRVSLMPFVNDVKTSFILDLELSSECELALNLLEVEGVGDSTEILAIRQLFEKIQQRELEDLTDRLWDLDDDQPDVEDLEQLEGLVSDLTSAVDEFDTRSDQIDELEGIVEQLKDRVREPDFDEDYEDHGPSVIDPRTDIDSLFGELVSIET